LLLSALVLLRRLQYTMKGEKSSLLFFRTCRIGAAYTDKEQMEGGNGMQRRGLTAAVGFAALFLGIGILLTFLLSTRALVLVLATCLIVAGSASYLLCRR